MMINIHEVCGQLLGILSIQARDQVNDLIDQIRINDKNDLLLFVGRLENTINFLNTIVNGNDAYERQRIVMEEQAKAEESIRRWNELLDYSCTDKE